MQRMASSSAPRVSVVNFNSPELNQLALALAQDGRLVSLVRPYLNKQRTWERVLAATPFAGTVYKRTFGRRLALDASLAALTDEAGVLPDVLAAVVGRAPWVSPAARRAVTARLHMQVREAVAQQACQWVQQSDCVVGYEGFALPAFAKAKALGRRAAVLNYPVAHHQQRRRVRLEEIAREPTFETTWPDFDDWPAGHEQRLDDEIAMADAILVGSTYAADSFVAAGVARSKMRVVPYGVDLATFCPGPASAATSGFEVIYAGQLTQRKGLSYLLRGYQRFARPGTRLTLVGSSVGDPAAVAPYAHLFEHVPHQTRPALAERYRAADVFVFPTLIEGMPLVVLEAMACGLPVIVTANGPGDIVRDGVEGFVIPERDDEAVADRLERLHRDPALRRAMGQAAAQRAHEFSWRAYATKAMSVLANAACSVLLMCGALQPTDVSAQAVGATRVIFDLPRSAVTSAGVYASDGTLLRTLWRAESLPAGRHVRSWDQRDDSGRAVGVGAGEVEIRLVHHQLRFEWEGVVGNSSAVFTGTQVHKAFQAPVGIVIDGKEAVYAVGYNEGQPGLHGFRLDAPALDTLPLPSTDPFVSYGMVAMDAERVYWANIGGVSKTSFVGAIDRSRRAPVPFQKGVPVCLNHWPNSRACYPDQDYKGVIDLQTDAKNLPAGIAVQRGGRVLAVARPKEQRVALFDKQSGERIGAIGVRLAASLSNQLAMTPDGDLWVISGTSLLRFTSLDTVPRQVGRIDGLVKPLTIASVPGREEELWVAEGGAQQQVKRLAANGAVLAVIGVVGGYAHDPQVQTEKLCLGGNEGSEQSAVAQATDGTVWIVEPCNNRMRRFRPESDGRWSSDAQIAYLPASYNATVDLGNPRRVFANFLEFELADAAPLKPGDRSWRLIRNWLGGMPVSMRDDRSENRAFGGFASVRTFANGRTFALMQTQNRQVLVELPSTGPLKLVRAFPAAMPGATHRVLYEDGNLGYAVTGSGSQQVMRLPLTGADETGAPQWSRDPVKLASVPTLKDAPYYRGAFSGMPPRFPLTASGRVIFFDGSVVGNEGFHLGAAAQGSDRWLWQASPSAALDGKGSFQTKAIDGSLHYGGNAVWAHGRHVVYGFHGEFYKDLQNGRVGQANQFMHFDESGLFLGQFGLASTRATEPAQAGLSGNAFSPTLVRDGDRLFVYHNDESAHGGVHRWRIDGWSDVGDLRGRGPMTAEIALY